MYSREFKPNIFAPGRIILFVISLGAPLYSLFVFLPQVWELSKYPELASTISYLYLVIGVSCLVPLVVLSFLIIPILSKKIEIEGELMYIFDRSLLGAQTMKVVHLKEVTKIGEEIKKVWNGKAMFIFYWWVLHFQNKETEKIYLTSWDKATLKKILFHIRDAYPKILFNTSVYRDSSEKLSGLEKYLKK